MRRVILVLLALVLCSVPLFSSAELSGKVSSDYEPLWKFAEPYGFKLGGCFGMWDLNNKAYMDFLNDHFISLTCTNETKAYSLLKQNLCKASEDGMPRMDYSAADRMIQWAADNGKVVRGHVLVWDAVMQYPWFFHEGYDAMKPLVTREVLLGRMENYIKGVMEYLKENYPGVVVSWDVLNEAVDDGAGILRNSNWN